MNTREVGERTRCWCDARSLVRVANKQMQTSRGVHIEGIGLVACLAVYINPFVRAGVSLRLRVLKELFREGSFFHFLHLAQYSRVKGAASFMTKATFITQRGFNLIKTVA